MPKFLVRIVALLLVPCLIADTAVAVVLWSATRDLPLHSVHGSQSTDHEWLTSQALANLSLYERPHPPGTATQDRAAEFLLNLSRPAAEPATNVGRETPSMDQANFGPGAANRDDPVFHAHRAASRATTPKKRAATVRGGPSSRKKRYGLDQEAEFDAVRLKRILMSPNLEVGDEKLLVFQTFDFISDAKYNFDQRYLEKAKPLVLAIYEEKMRKQRSRVPAGFWLGKQGSLNKAIILRYLIKEKEKWPIDMTLPAKVNGEWIRTVGLAGCLASGSIKSLYGILAFAFPQEAFDPGHPEKPHTFHPWDAFKVGEWDKENEKAAIRDVIENHEGWSIDTDLPAKANQSWFVSKGLGGLTGVFASNLYQSLVIAYPEHAYDSADPQRAHRFHPWDAKVGAWDANEVRLALRHMIEVHEKWPIDSELPRKVDRNWLTRVHLISVLRHAGDSTYNLLELAYPEYAFDWAHPAKPHNFHPWDGQMQWGGDDALMRQAIRHMIEYHEGWAIDSDLPAKVTQAWFIKVHLSGLLSHYFNSSPYKALEFAYPEHAYDFQHPTRAHMFHSWDTRMGTWSPETARHAVRHQIEHHEHWEINSELASRVTLAWLQESHLEGVRVFLGSVYSALANAYPGHAYDSENPQSPHLFHPWDASITDWKEGQLRDAIRHMIEDHEKWAVDETLPAKVTAKWFLKVNLMGALSSWFGLSPYRALAFTYTEQAYDPANPGKPHVFHPWDGQMQWGGDEGLMRQAIRHMVEFHENWPINESLSSNITRAWLQRSGLGGLFSGKFHKSKSMMLGFAYPEIFRKADSPASPERKHSDQAGRAA